MSIGLLIVFGVLLGIAFIFCGASYLHDYLVRGDYEDKTKFYTNRFSFNKTLDKKMKYFPNQNMLWLKIFMNFILPSVAILHMQGFFEMFIRGGVDRSIAAAATGSPGDRFMSYFVPIAFFFAWLFSFFAALAIRFIDKMSFVVIILFSVAEIVYFFAACYPLLFVQAIIVSLLLIANISYFVKRRELFWKSTKELKELYSLDD